MGLDSRHGPLNISPWQPLSGQYWKSSEAVHTYVCPWHTLTNLDQINAISLHPSKINCFSVVNLLSLCVCHFLQMKQLLSQLCNAPSNHKYFYYYIVIMITLKFIYYDYVSVPSNRTTIEIRNSLFVLDSSVFWNEMMVLWRKKKSLILQPELHLIGVT